jgi:MSHA biogenesis protein MshL
VRAPLAALSVVVALGCATRLDRDPRTVPPGPGEVAIDEARTAPPGGDPAVPESTWRTLLPPLTPTAHAPEPDEARFDVSVREMPAREFYLSLVEGTPINMVVDPALDGRITLTLKQVTLGETLDTVRAVYGYEYDPIPGGYHVMPPRLLVRVFELGYLNVRRSGRSQTRVSSGQVTGQSSAAELVEGSRPEAVSGSVISTDSDTDLWADIEHALREIVAREDDRRVVVNPDSGVIVVRALPRELRDVEHYLASVQLSLGRQVILEAKIIEVTLSDSFRTGINWTRLSDFGSNDLAVLGSQIGGGTALGSTLLSEIAGNTGQLDPRLVTPPSGTDTSAFGGVFTLSVEAENFSAFLEALEQQGEVQVLSSPRISTLNNQKAVIKVGSDEFFVTDVSTTTVTGTSTTTNPDIELTPFFSGIALDVTPHIGDDGIITLHIHPSVSDVSDQIKSISIGGQSQTLPLARSDIRETDSIVRARSQQIVVIGGLMQDIATARRAATPWVSKVPLLGSLFEHNLESATKKELVILLRPVLIGRDGWRREIERSAERIDAHKQRFYDRGKP